MKKGNDLGFSLVEMIIVVAIMAILLAVMVPMLLKYVEKTNVSSDTQLCDSVREAIVIAANDPAVLSANDKSRDMINRIFSTTASGYVLGGSGKYGSDYLDCAFSKEVEENLGFNPFSSDGHEYMKSSPAKEDGGLMVATNDEGTQIAIWIQHSDSIGKKRDNTSGGNGFRIADLPSAEVIYAE